MESMQYKNYIIIIIIQEAKKWHHRGTIRHPQESQTGQVHGGATGYYAMTPLIKIALSQFSDSDQTNNISQELSENLHKLSPCQKLLTTKSDLTKITP